MRRNALCGMAALLVLSAPSPAPAASTDWIEHDGGSGRCFPAGHASTGFAFMGGFFALRTQAPGMAGLWLAVALAAGLLFGGVQQLRGAHFMSHTLWTAWLCWVVGWLADPLFARSVGTQPEFGA